ncbi:hypothetical protein B0H10DRAFT_2441123 [Mycena sp. CBHHK59/15]|nr:hypothetical protein B0H10DRAFT_2441123 [Mycena sp. CBHHK59/15]
MTEKDFALASLLQSSDKELEGYKRWLGLPLELAESPFFGASNKMNWVKVDKYAMYLRDVGGKSRENTREDTSPNIIEVSDDDETPPPPSCHPIPTKRVSAEVIEISDDDDSASSAPPPKKHVKHVNIKIKVEPKLEPVPASVTTPITTKQSKDRRIVITKRESVEKVVELSGIPERWPVPDVDTAYILDLSGIDSRVTRGETYTGKPKGLDTLLKAEDQDSWEMEATAARLGIPNLLYSVIYHLGAQSISAMDYERTTLDMDLTRELFARELQQNVNDSATSGAVTASFFRVIQGLKCKKSDCAGKAIIKYRENGPSNDGKLKFVGCSKWKKDELYEHLYSAIPSAVDEEILTRYMNGMPVEDLDEHDNLSCSRFVHPRHGKQSTCPHAHFRDGKPVVGKMVPYPCAVKKIVYTSMDSSIKKVVVIFRGRHSHPPWPMEKPGITAKADLDKCLDGMGTLGTTGGRLNNSTTTRAILGSNLGTKHPAFRNKRKLRDAVLSRKDASTPAGLLWAGILDEYEQDLKLPKDERYIRVVRMEGELKVAVTMNSELAQLVHEVQFLVPDFTFKRTEGDLNEWEVAVWLDGSHERTSVTRSYCNKATKEAFMYIFDGFFMAIEQVTGSPVRFKVFDPEGNILSIHFDMEAAQIQGFALALLKLLRHAHPEKDPDVIVRYVVKLCSVHFERSTDALIAAVGQETVNYLNRIRGLRVPADIEAWHKFCREHSNKKLRDWYEHKIRYSWLLPGYNESLSRFPPGFWDRTPSHTNLVESTHVATNRETGIRLLPLEAIQRARVFDAERVAAIRANKTTCILTNHNNNDQTRMRRALGRQSQRRARREQHSELENGITDARKELAEVSKAKKLLAARVKDLTAEKKTLGRAPRNSHLIDRYGSADNIPRVSSSTPISVNNESDVEMFDAPPSSDSDEPAASLFWRSSPPPPTDSDFDSALTSEFEDDATQSEWGHMSDWQNAALDYSAPHMGYYLLGAPGFDLDAFLAACEDQSSAQ